MRKGERQRPTPSKKQKSQHGGVRKSGAAFSGSVEGGGVGVLPILWLLIFVPFMYFTSFLFLANAQKVKVTVRPTLLISQKIRDDARLILLPGHLCVCDSVKVCACVAFTLRYYLVTFNARPRNNFTPSRSTQVVKRENN